MAEFFARLVQGEADATVGDLHGRPDGHEGAFRPLQRRHPPPGHHGTCGRPGYHEEARWNLLTAQTPGTIPLYGCLNGAADYYVSTDAGCGGTQYSILQTEGWIYTDPPEAPSTALYRCYIRSLGDHFVSTRSDCEAPGNPDVAPEGRLGYALT